MLPKLYRVNLAPRAKADLVDALSVRLTRLAAERGGAGPPAKTVLAAMATADATLVTRAADVVEAVWRAETDPASPLRMPAGTDAVALAQAR